MRYFIFVFVIYAVGCQSKKQLPDDFKLISEMQCRAAKLKERRFELSKNLIDIDAVRPIDTLKRDSVLKLVQHTQAISLKLADSIKLKLDTLFATTYINDKERQEFNDLLKVYVQKNNCSLLKQTN